MIYVYWLFLALFHITLASSSPPKYCSFKNATMLTCKKHLPNMLSTNNVTVLELYHLDWDVIDLNKIIEKFPNAENVSVFGRNIFRIIPPTSISKIRVLQLKHLKITSLSQSFLENLPNLEVLNVEGNLLESLPKNISLGKIKQLYLYDNQWSCSEDLEWVLNLDPNIIQNFHELICHGEPYPGKPLVPIAKFVKDIKEECPDLCNCTLPKVVQNPESDVLEPIIEVNCSDRGLTQLPDNFPPNTKILHLEGNEIEDLFPMRTNKKYRGVLDLYLDNNRINTIEVLEGSYWLTHFRVFSLSGNKLSELPSYAMDNALQQNSNMPNAVRITLGGNPWRCDCVFTPVFQAMLQKYEPQVKDISEVKCSYVEGDENSLLPIVDLSRSSVCQFPTEYSVQEALDLLNAVLGFLIIFVLGKLAYDYYHFKKTGRLPWIVTKMP